MKKEMTYILATCLLLVGLCVQAQVPATESGRNVFTPFGYPPQTHERTNEGASMRQPQFQMRPGTKIAQAFSLVQNWYVDADSLDMNGMEEETLRDMLRRLDPHSSYLSREEARVMNESMRGHFEGIGTATTIYRDTAMVVSLSPNGPAARAGIQIGDRIVTVNMQPVTGRTLNRDILQQTLRGERGTRVILGIKRKHVSRLLSIPIVRSNIPVESIEAAYLVTPTIGYIKLARFSNTTYEEMVKAIGRLQWQGMQRLILDICENSGGLLDAAVKVADEFLSEGQLILYTGGDRQQRTDYVATRAGLFHSGALALMIDEGSASGSEILAGAIQDWDRGILIGRRTFGKGLVQRQIVLQDGSMIRLTVARYHTPSGRVIQKPYMNTREDYNREAFSRDARAEFNFWSHRPDTASAYRSLIAQRPLLGGGGILPDVYVAPDSMSAARHNARHAEWLNQTVAGLIDRYGHLWLRQYRDADSFIRHVDITPDMLAQIQTDNRPRGGRQEDPENQALNIKQALVRNLWGSEAYWKLYNETNPVFLKALEELQNMVPSETPTEP